MTYSSIFGPLVGVPQVSAAALTMLQTWLPTYLWEIERANVLVRGTIPHPPTPESFRADRDFLGWQQDECPTVIAVVNPTGETERSASAGYSQWFEIQIGAVVIDETEETAELIAGYYGTAIQGAILQNGSLGGISQRTEMTSAPRLEFQDPDERLGLQAAATFEVLVPMIVNDRIGPDAPTPAQSSQYGGAPSAPFNDWPTVRTPGLQVQAEPITQE